MIRGEVRITPHHLRTLPIPTSGNVNLAGGARALITGRRPDGAAMAIDQLRACGGPVDGVRAKMIAMNREDRAAIDRRFSDLKPTFAEAVRDDAAL